MKRQTATRRRLTVVLLLPTLLLVTTLNGSAAGPVPARWAATTRPSAA